MEAELKSSTFSVVGNVKVGKGMPQVSRKDFVTMLGKLEPAFERNLSDSFSLHQRFKIRPTAE